MSRITPEELCKQIEEISEEMVISRLGYKPTVWYTGGSEHNDNRLFAEVAENGRILVRDNNGTAEYLDDESRDSSDESEIRDYVRYWLDCLYDD